VVVALVVVQVVLDVVTVWSVQGLEKSKPDRDDHDPAGHHVRTRATSFSKVARS